jgi:hypothetical protein
VGAGSAINSNSVSITGLLAINPPWFLACADAPQSLAYRLCRT